MDKRQHRIAGSIAGGAVVLAKELENGGTLRVERVVGGILGGISGCDLPDRLELPTNPNHRATLHSVGTGALLVWTMKDAVRLSDELAVWRDQAYLEARERDDPWGCFWCAVRGLLCGVASGMVLGLPAGYLSHLALDSTTPKSIPLM